MKTSVRSYKSNNCLVLGLLVIYLAFSPFTFSILGSAPLRSSCCTILIALWWLAKCKGVPCSELCTLMSVELLRQRISTIMGRFLLTAICSALIYVLWVNRFTSICASNTRNDTILGVLCSTAKWRYVLPGISWRQDWRYILRNSSDWSVIMRFSKVFSCKEAVWESDSLVFSD